MSRPRREKLETLSTEKPNSASRDLDLKSPLQIARIINKEDVIVAGAVRKALPKIARAIEWVADALQKGGRLIYVGTGTSGRIAALDAAEIPPTFDVDPRRVQFVMAGGEKALARAVEADEDSRALGVRMIRRKKPGKQDVVIGVAASGRTPFTIAAVEYARRAGAKTVALACNRSSPLEKTAELAIVVETGPEVVAGSTRMKAGTAEKMVLNMISTGAMVRLGYVYGNLMVNLRQKNRKLSERAVSIVQKVLRVERQPARRILRAAGNDLPTALVMAKTGCSASAAQGALKSAVGRVHQAIQLLTRTGHSSALIPK